MDVESRTQQARPFADKNDGAVKGVISKAVVLGLGNVLLGDDGVGVHVIERLRAGAAMPAGTELYDGGTLNFSLLERVEKAALLVAVDAAYMNVKPGTVRVFANAAMDEFLSTPAQRSVHGVNLADLLRMCALRDALPVQRVLVGIQPEFIGWNCSSSAAVVAAIEVACERVRALLTGLLP